MSDFINRRRQQFIWEDYFDVFGRFLIEGSQELREQLLLPSNSDDDRRRLNFFIAQDAFQLLSVKYTAGVQIEPLRHDLETVITAYELYQTAFVAYSRVEHAAPLGFETIVEYERIMQLISLCYLLHRRDLLPRIAAMIDPAYAGEDTLYEDLLAYELEDRYDVDEWYHDKPYRDLINALYRDTPEESIADLKKYLKAWYPAMSKCPWHDSHLRMTATDGDYFGYWAFEAGAVAYLLELDDSEIDHMVYPKDLVAFAREFVPDEQVNRDENLRLRCEGGQPCPKDGWWWSPAAGVEGRRHFKQGEIMPIVESDYGDTIWQWDEQQNS